MAKVDYADLLNGNPDLLLNIKAASSKVKKGARWLDVRLADEHSRNGFHDSLNISLNQLPGELDNLAKDQQYIVYCDNGIRSSAAATLLATAGFYAFYLQGGYVKYSGIKI